MRLFECQHCGQVLFFENTSCERCGHRLGTVPDSVTLVALATRDAPPEPSSDSEPTPPAGIPDQSAQAAGDPTPPSGGIWRSLAKDGGLYKFCANAEFDACNWLIPADNEAKYCIACRHNHVVPDLSVEGNIALWRTLEVAKHRLFYTLLRLHLPLVTRAEDPEHGLAFDFLADAPAGASKVMTGHDNGLITIALSEADDAQRERMRTEMGENYRTPLGHFRHEVGHHYWDLLVRDGGRLEEFRAVFGDESQDYEAALQAHYQNGAPADWQAHFVSAYATAHPWEDFAETWAHYIHIIDTLEMAAAFGMGIHPKIAADGALDATIRQDPYHATNMELLVNDWIKLTVAMNSLNRSMGQPDPYPFVLSPAVVDKLSFIHGLVHQAG
jgi:hypothetical protein